MNKEQKPAEQTWEKLLGSTSRHRMTGPELPDQSGGGSGRLKPTSLSPAGCSAIIVGSQRTALEAMVKSIPSPGRELLILLTAQLCPAYHVLPASQPGCL